MSIHFVQIIWNELNELEHPLLNGINFTLKLYAMLTNIAYCSILFDYKFTFM